MIASEHREMAAGVRITALFNILYPCAIHAHCDVVLFFAGDRAGVTTDAAVLIDDKSVTHFKPFALEDFFIDRKFFILIAEKNEKGQTNGR